MTILTTNILSCVKLARSLLTVPNTINIYSGNLLKNVKKKMSKEKKVVWRRVLVERHSFFVYWGLRPTASK